MRGSQEAVLTGVLFHDSQIGTQRPSSFNQYFPLCMKGSCKRTREEKKETEKRKSLEREEGHCFPRRQTVTQAAHRTHTLARSALTSAIVGPSRSGPGGVLGCCLASLCRAPVARAVLARAGIPMRHSVVGAGIKWRVSEVPQPYVEE